jgi:hypothetical protein
MTFKINPKSKSYAEKNAKARAQALRSAERNIAHGRGALAEAIEAYDFFYGGFPSLNKYIGRIEYMKIYRSHPQWARLRELRLID